MHRDPEMSRPSARVRPGSSAGNRSRVARCSRAFTGATVVLMAVVTTVTTAPLLRVWMQRLGHEIPAGRDA